ncbi:DUF2293 domain-containing protein [Candidatus Tokpelaia sp.]|uniref:DUF2293 domain-containing protein n=1 Tax=Candidatus Tokpelaia sp. TaxID=2233777 RepID=UPI00123940BD|nr:DUF2293 domain-containing protein [Candidatus Tokpelaia sp.]KAA6405853.1 DUF2293 domain-containing protein [Candidatus Tokpelaia sp.]
MTSKRQSAIAKAVARFIPQAPFYDAEAIRSRAAQKHLRNLPPDKAVWLTIIAYIRHIYTDYDALRDENYESEAARFFVRNAINSKLQQWRAGRFLMIEEAQTAADKAPVHRGKSGQERKI